MWLFIKILVCSNQHYENVTISANNLALRQKFRASERKNLQNMPKDGYINNSWEFTLFSWQEPLKWYIVLNLLFFLNFIFKFNGKVKIYNSRNHSNDTTESQKKKPTCLNVALMFCGTASLVLFSACSWIFY